MTLPIQTALVSVSDKTGVAEFCRFAARGVKILSTGGTASLLKKEGIAVTEVSEQTGFPEIMDGRVKTLHPKIHGGLLARRDDPAHVQAMQTHGIAPIDLVAINLYPFEETVAKGASAEDCIENIDIGGPGMIRSAAKNHASVTVIVDPADYATVRQSMEQNHGATTRELRTVMAAKAFTRTAAYDAAISGWFMKKESGVQSPESGEAHFPQNFTLTGMLRQPLRYGENPHQKAAFYALGESHGTLAGARQVQGKELSYNNLNDTSAALLLVREFSEPAVAVIKHANPCGVAVGRNTLEAYKKAFAGDPQSAFGGIIALNRPLDLPTAEAIGKQFAEVIVAPDADAAALAFLATKKNLRVLLTGESAVPASLHITTISGGLLVQEPDRGVWDEVALKVATKTAPDAQQMADLKFAFTVAKHVKSNAIVLAKDGRTVGIGAGQMSRVDSVRIACWKAEEAKLSTQGAVLASDAFFPFDDNVHAAAKAGIAAIIQPGGSMRDNEVIAAADQHAIPMVFTGLRHFRH